MKTPHAKTIQNLKAMCFEIHKDYNDGKIDINDVSWLTEYKEAYGFAGNTNFSRKHFEVLFNTKEVTYEVVESIYRNCRYTHQSKNRRQVYEPVYREVEVYNLENISDDVIIGELRKRGYTGTLNKPLRIEL